MPVDEYLPIMFDEHPELTWKNYYTNRNLLAFTAEPLLVYPTHYTGDSGYISDTENTTVIEEGDGVEGAVDVEGIADGILKDVRGAMGDFKSVKEEL